MNPLLVFLFCFILAYSTCWIAYITLNKGISSRSKHQQGFRFATTCLLASTLFTIHIYSSYAVVFDLKYLYLLLLPLGTCLLRMVTYPLLFHLTNRKSMPEYDNFMDITFATYLLGIYMGLSTLSIAHHWIIYPLSILECITLLSCAVQIAYYLLYKVCIDANGMKTILETHINEIIEFVHSFSPLSVLFGIFLFSGICIFTFKVNSLLPIEWAVEIVEIPVIVLIVVSLYFLFFTHKSVFSRTGLYTLRKVIVDYKEKNKAYVENREKRIQTLDVENRYTESLPHTILMVIGESASRDYMSAFTPQPRETTPWLSSQKTDTRHFLLFPNAYSCANQTVPTLERALTEKSQYNDKEFFESCSIIDIARKSGYATHWYSNQGHLGSADTPITLVAESCDVAKWTKQEVGKPQYDETLIDFLQELDPQKNNFLVLHLKGSHFNFINRYPASYPEAKNTSTNDFEEQYRTSLHYTDHVLQQAFEYCSNHLNLHCMFYFSDHGDCPLGRRSPDFKGFGPVRIPMFVYCSDQYQVEHPERYEAIQNNKEKYFTNDLIYDLACGLLDIRSSHFEEQNSLASDTYQFTREELLTNEGRTHICEDNN